MTNIDLLDGLNPSQKQAVSHIDGPLLMLAGPGSGKTRVVTHRVGYMIQQGISPTSILALTFTNKAADDMRSRLHRLVGDVPVWMGTFHGFCVRLLRRYARLVGLPENFSIYDTDDALSVLKTALQAAQFSLTHVSLNTLAEKISFYKNRLVTPEQLQAEALSSDEHQISQIYPFYQQQLLKCGAVDFDDLLMHTAVMLRSSPALQAELDERFRYVMVDEYQDTNLAQYVILRHLCVRFPNLAATGDPDQSIYGWRGANLQNIAYLERDYPTVRIVRLEQNYRSTPEILAVADGLIQNNQYRKAKRLVPTRVPGTPVRLSVYATARREAEDIAEQIAAGVNAGQRHLRDYAVLYRTNAQSRLIEQGLQQRHMPYQVIGGYRFYLRREVKDLVAYLLLLNNPDDNVAFERVINTPPRGIGKQTLQKISQASLAQRLSMLAACRTMVAEKSLDKRALSGLTGFLKLFDTLSEYVHGSLVELIRTTIELTGYREYLAKQNSRDDRDADALANLDELLAEAADLDHSTDDGSPLESFLEYAALQGDLDKMQSDGDLVTLMTLHAAKGLEFPCVYIIALEENILPHQRSRDEPLGLEEERRLLFVGLTRAQDQLQLSYARRRGFRGQESPVIPSSFLMELPRDQMQRIDLSESSDEYSQDEFGVDDYNQAAPLWDDDPAQTVRATHDSHDYDTLDDVCQVAPDELDPHSINSTRSLMLASNLASTAANSSRYSPKLYCQGRIVCHPTYGSGRIIAASGLGPKRSVTVEFFSDGLRHTFRLSHVHLNIEEES